MNEILPKEQLAKRQMEQEKKLRRCCRITFCFCKKKHVCGFQREPLSEKEREILETAYDNILDRMIDWKYYFQMCQDYEIMKKVFFKERH